jgi:predicted membrane protein
VQSSQSVSMFFLICQALVFENESASSFQYILFSVLLIIVFSLAALFHAVSFGKNIRLKVLEKKENKDLASAVDLNNAVFMDKTGTEVELHLAENPVRGKTDVTNAYTTTETLNPTTQSIRGRLASINLKF